MLTSISSLTVNSSTNYNPLLDLNTESQAIPKPPHQIFNFSHLEVPHPTSDCKESRTRLLPPPTTNNRRKLCGCV